MTDSTVKLRESLADTQSIDLKAMADALPYKGKSTLKMSILRPESDVVEATMDKNIYVLGRDPSVDVVLDDPTVSRQHAQITFNQAEGYFQLTDLSAKNGIIFRDHPIKSMILLDGDTFELGSVKVGVAIA